MKKLLLFFIKNYKIYLSRLVKYLFGSGCRFYPTCSEYTKKAIEKYGTLKGVWLGIKRFLKCNPWGEMGWDPVN